MISMKNYEFSVKGLHIGHDGKFPEADVDALRALFERNESLTAKNILTDMHLLTPENGGNDKVVVFDYELFDNKGTEHVRGYAFNMKGDQEFELEIA
jgi:hypothetical protein